MNWLLTDLKYWLDDQWDRLTRKSDGWFFSRAMGRLETEDGEGRRIIFEAWDQWDAKKKAHAPFLNSDLMKLFRAIRHRNERCYDERSGRTSIRYSKDQRGKHFEKVKMYGERIGFKGKSDGQTWSDWVQGTHERILATHQGAMRALLEES